MSTGNEVLLHANAVHSFRACTSCTVTVIPVGSLDRHLHCMAVLMLKPHAGHRRQSLRPYYSPRLNPEEVR